MNTTFEEAQQELKKIDKIIFRYQFAFIPLMAVALLLMLIHPFLCIAFLIFSLFWQGVLFRRGRRLFSDCFNHYRILLSMGPTLAGIRHVHQEGIELATVTAARIFPTDEKNAGISQQEHVTGTAGKLPVEISDLSCICRHKEGGTDRLAPVAGSFISITLPEYTGCDWRLVEKGSFNELARRQYFGRQNDLEKTSTGIDWVDQKFDFYRPLNSDEVPSAGVLKQIRALMEYNPLGMISVAVSGNRMDGFIKSRMLCFKTPYIRKVTEDMLRKSPYEELDYFVRMAGQVGTGRAAETLPKEQND